MQCRSNTFIEQRLLNNIQLYQQAFDNNTKKNEPNDVPMQRKYHTIASRFF